MTKEITNINCKYITTNGGNQGMGEPRSRARKEKVYGGSNRCGWLVN